MDDTETNTWLRHIARAMAADALGITTLTPASVRPPRRDRKARRKYRKLWRRGLKQEKNVLLTCCYYESEAEATERMAKFSGVGRRHASCSQRNMRYVYVGSNARYAAAFHHALILLGLRARRRGRRRANGTAI